MLSWQILRRLPQPLPPWCRKSRGKIEWLVGHQNGGKRLISPPTYSKIDVEQLLFTKVHHKVSKNKLKVGGGVALTMKFGETEVLDLFWLIFIFLPMYFPLRDPTGLQWNLGKGLFVFLLIHISDLCAIASHFSTQGAWYCPSDLFEMSGVDQNHRKLEVMAVCVFRVVHLFHGNRSARKYMIAHVMQFTIHIINPLYMGMDASR